MEEKSLLDRVDTDRVIKKALARGGGFADIFCEEKSTTLIEVEDGRIENLVQGTRRGAGVRVIYSHRTAYSYSDNAGTKALLDCASIASTAVGTGERRRRISPGGQWKLRRIRSKEDAGKAGVEGKLDLVWKAEAAARKFDPRIRQVRVIYSDQARRIAVANSNGLLAADRVPYVVLYVIAVAADETGIQVAHEAASGTVGLELFKKRRPEELAFEAAARAIRNLEAGNAPAGAMPVVLASEAGGTMIHEAVGHGLEADLAEQGMSVYAGKVDRKVASPLVTVWDDSTRKGWRGSFSIDDEGTPAKKTVLVDKGVLRSYMFDLRLAAKTGKRSTANGRRESYAHPPIVRMSNTMIAPGTSDPEEIIRSVDRGLLVKRMGGGQVNTVSGDFVFEVGEGYLIEKGAQAEAVRGATLTGNGPKVLMEIDMVGSDLGVGIGTCGKDGQGVPVSDAQPTIRIPEIVVGGRI